MYEEEELQAWLRLQERSPLEYPHGYLAGEGGFLWFASESELCRVIYRHLPTITDLETSTVPEVLEKAEADLEDVVDLVASAAAQRVSDLFNDYLAGAIPLNEMLDRVNLILPPSYRIEWWGRFDDLLNGESAVPRRVRTWFRERTALGGGARPISRYERDQFIAMLQEFG
jgi:hypothetical protein